MSVVIIHMLQETHICCPPRDPKYARNAIRCKCTMQGFGRLPKGIASPIVRLWIFAGFLFLFGNLCKAQVNASVNRNEENIVGLTQYASSGLFLTPSPSVVEMGEMGVGIFYNGNFSRSQSITSFPVGAVFGVTNRVEAYGAFYTSTKSPLMQRSYSTLGLKINFLNTELDDLRISADVRFQRTELSDGANVPQEGATLMGSVIAGYPLWGESTGYLQLGYALVRDGSLPLRARFAGGVGLAFPMSRYFLLISEADVNEDLLGQSMVAGRLGIKCFLLNHLQVALGLLGTHFSEKFVSGVFLGLSFSSETLNAVRDIGGKLPPALPEPPPLEKSPQDTTTSGGI